MTDVKSWYEQSLSGKGSPKLTSEQVELFLNYLSQNNKGYVQFMEATRIEQHRDTPMTKYSIFDFKPDSGLSSAKQSEASFSLVRRLINLASKHEQYPVVYQLWIM